MTAANIVDGGENPTYGEHNTEVGRKKQTNKNKTKNPHGIRRSRGPPVIE